MSKILITGISSEIMQRFTQWIDNSHFDLVGITRNRTNLNHSNVTIFEGDLCDLSSLETAMRDCDMVIHAAAITHSFEGTQYFKTNFEATKNLVDMANDKEVRKFVFVSSRAAGIKSGAYGMSKLMAEEYIQNKSNDWLIFRPAEVFGTSKKEGIENLIEDTKKKKIMICPTGLKSKLYPIYLEDVAIIMHDCIFNKKDSRKIITINGDQGFSISEIVRLVSQAAGKRTFIIPVPRIFMFAIKWVLQTFNIQAGIMPDQISRLYSFKETENLGYELKGLQEYLTHLMGNSN